MKVTIRRIRATAEWRYDMREDRRRAAAERERVRAPSRTAHRTPQARGAAAGGAAAGGSAGATGVDDDDEGGSSGFEQNADEEEDDVCGICRAPFDMTCPRPTCLVPGDACPPVWGACTHAFHMHCIVKWLEMSASGSEEARKQECPMCRTAWEFA